MSAQKAFKTLSANDYRRIVKQKPHGAYLFCGGEEYMKQHCLAETRKAVTEDATLAAFNILRFAMDGDSLPAEEIMNALNSPPMFCERHLIELAASDLNSASEELLDALCELASAVDEETVFILTAGENELSLGDLPKNRPSKAFSKLCEAFSPVLFEAETPAKLAAWIAKHFASDGITADSDLCYALMRRCGHSMLILASETDKLCEYLHARNRKELARQDIEAVSCEYTELGDFAFSNAILARDRSAAFAILGVMRSNREKPELILASVTGIFANMSFVRALTDCGLTVSETASRLGVNEYRVTLWQRALLNTSAEQLDRLCALCMEADVAMKTSAADKFVVIDRMLAAAL